jgi:hypothetical protein
MKKIFIITLIIFSGVSYSQENTVDITHVGTDLPVDKEYEFVNLSTPLASSIYVQALSIDKNMTPTEFKKYWNQSYVNNQFSYKKLLKIVTLNKQQNIKAD